MRGYNGTVWLFGIFPIVRNMYLPFEGDIKFWESGIHGWLRWVCVIRWKEENPMCTRDWGHDGPCNGLPGKFCKVWQGDPPCLQ